MIDAEWAAQLSALGVSVDAEAIPASRDVDVWPENWDAVTVFLDCSTQWEAVERWGVGMLRTGLRYADVDVVLKRRGFEGDEVFALVRIMEQEALPILNERFAA